MKCKNKTGAMETNKPNNHRNFFIHHKIHKTNTLLFYLFNLFLFRHIPYIYHALLIILMNFIVDMALGHCQKYQPLNTH